jgi:hypothetical protein
MGRKLQFTDRLKGEFLLELAKCGEYAAAAAAVGFSPKTVYAHRNQDPEFDEACTLARGRFYGELLETARKLAIDGIEQIRLDREGNPVATGEKRFSERILLAWLRRTAPDEWSDRVKVDQRVAGKVEHEHAIDPRTLTPDQRRCIRQLLSREN